ncbi:disulfide bond formation protein B [bacterium]|nr:disulfide bond formation protein B [bacterium]
MTPQYSANMDSSSSSAATIRIWELLALAVSLVALAGSLYLSMGMKLKACPLCLYERTFMMGLVGVLLMGLMRSGDARPGFSVLLGLPLAVSGLCVAAFHVFLELTDVLECPLGLFGIGTAPQQSLVAFLIVTVLIGVALARCSKGAAWIMTCLGAIVLGVLFSGAAIKSAPPLPKPPSEPYTTPMEGCRPIFIEISQAADSQP